MAYTKTVWKDRIVATPTKYKDQANVEYTFTPVPGEIIEEGTPVNAVNLNKIEDGIEKAGKITYSQIEEPTVFEDGEQWFNPNTEILAIASSGRWVNVPPLSETYHATGFGSGGGATLSSTFNKTEAISPNYDIKLVDGELVGTGATLPSGSSSAYTQHLGFAFIPSVNCAGIAYSLPNALASGTTVYLRTSSGVDLATLIGTDAKRWIFYPLVAGTKYHLTCYASGTSRSVWSTSGSPTQGSNVSIVAGISGTTEVGSKFGFNGIQLLDYVYSGDAVIKMTSIPTTIKYWDLFTYQLDKDGETIELDVIDATTGEVLFSNIPQNFNISTISPSINVGIKVRMSRVNPIKTPIVSYMGWRYLR